MPVGKSGSVSRDQFGRGPLSTPACDGDAVYVLGQHGDFVAFDVKDGKERWRKNIVAELDAKRMNNTWSFSMSPMLDGDKIVFPVGGGGGTLVAFDKSGKLLWRTDWIKDDAAFTSAVPVTIEGVRQYVVLTGKSIFGVSTDGKQLWQAECPGGMAVCTDPTLCGDVVMTSCDYGVGAFFYRITQEGDGFKEVSSFHADKEFQCQHGGIVAVGDHYYFLTNRAMFCVEAKTGKVVWQDRSIGKGAVLYADGKLYLRAGPNGGGDGTMAMIEATPTGYKELGRFDQPERSEKQTWTYPVIVDKKMYIRDQGLLLCYALD
jgi:outer membrane protein assembly factor BamB